MVSGSDYLLYILDSNLYFYKPIALFGGNPDCLVSLIHELYENQHSSTEVRKMFAIPEYLNDHTLIHSVLKFKDEPLTGEHDDYGWHYPLYAKMEIESDRVVFKYLNMKGTGCIIEHKTPWPEDLEIRLTFKEAVTTLTEMAIRRHNEPINKSFAEYSPVHNEAITDFYPDIYEPLKPSLSHNYLMYIKTYIDNGEMDFIDLLRLGCFSTINSLILNFNMNEFVEFCITLIKGQKFFTLEKMVLIHYFLMNLFEFEMNDYIKSIMNPEILGQYTLIKAEMESLELLFKRE